MNAQRLSKLRISKIDLVDRGAAVGARITLFKRHEPVAKESAPMTLEECMASLNPEQKAAVMAALEQAAAKSKDAPPPPAPSDEEKKKAEEAAIKALSPELRKRLDERDAEAAIAKKRADELEEQVRKMQDADEEREYIAKAKSEDFVHFPGLATNELGQVLRCVAKGRALPPALSAKFEQAISGVSSTIKASNLFKSFGSNGADTSADPNEQLKAIAKDLRSKDASLDDVQAINKAYALRPDLYKAAREADRKSA